MIAPVLSLAFVLFGCQAPTAAPAPKAFGMEPQPQPSQGARQHNPKRRYQLSGLQRVQIEVASHKLQVWLMDSELKRMEGMMFLTDAEVKDDEGMLFVFAREEPRSFWMRNTLIPLDIAYIGKDGKIVSTHQMAAYDERGTLSKGPAMYALEMKMGAFKRLGIKAGQKVTIPASVKSQDEF